VKKIRDCFREVVEIEPPLQGADEVFEVLRATSYRVRYDSHYTKNKHLLGPNLIANIEQALGYDFADAARAQENQNSLYQRFTAYMQDFDILLSPTAAVPPFPVEQLYPTHINGTELRGYFHWLALAYGTSVTGFPSVSLPCGLDATGTPFGLQVCGQRYGDHKLMGVAAAMEQMLGATSGLERPMPDLAALSE
jgi:Asp-tRNA(Asn)/Glu-tRNA(Gln) amidotransferase A subunit family amidase